MKRSVIRAYVIACLLAILTTTFHAQSHEKVGEQSSFQEDEEFQHPVDLPAPVFNTLRRDKIAQDCLKYDPTIKEVAPSWFEAAKVTLGQDASSGFVVHGKKSCLSGADTSSFWVFRKSGPDYDLVLTAHGNSLTLLSSYTNRWRDIVVLAATAADFYTKEYSFRDGQYRLSKSTVEPVSPDR
jgi:hypothetical protein